MRSQTKNDMWRAMKRQRKAGGRQSLMLAMGKSEYARNIAHFLVQQKIICKAGRTVLEEAGLRAYKVACPKCEALPGRRCTYVASEEQGYAVFENPFPHLPRFRRAFEVKPRAIKCDALDHRVPGSFESASK